MSIKVTEENANEIVSKDGIVVLDFWAEWCGPCRVYAPIIDEFSSENPDITVGKVNVDENPNFAAKHGIRSIPTTIMFQNGQIITKIPGVVQKSKLEEFTNNLK